MTSKNKFLRKCVGCNQMKEKSELFRIVKISDEKYVMDSSNKCNGRGAYICKSKECIAKAQKTRGLERSFKCKIPEELYSGIFQEIENNEA